MKKLILVCMTSDVNLFIITNMISIIVMKERSSLSQLNSDKMDVWMDGRKYYYAEVASSS